MCYKGKATCELYTVYSRVSVFSFLTESLESKNSIDMYFFAATLQTVGSGHIFILDSIGTISNCREFPRVSDWSDLRCSLNNRQQDNTTLSSTISISHVRPNEFICSYETHCFALCMCCDFFACDCRMKCSDGCHCFHDQVINQVALQMFIMRHRANILFNIPLSNTFWKLSDSL